MRIILKTSKPFAMAGLYDTWKDPKGGEINSFTIITTQAAGALKAIHDRMPVILDPGAEDPWLDAKSDPQDLRRLLVPCADGLLDAYQVSPLVNSPAHEWYARKTLEHGWSRAMLVHQIESNLHKREGQAVTNFKDTLPPPQSDLAQQAIKDPYTFDFMTLAGDAKERELEHGLVDHIQKFLIELKAGEFKSEYAGKMNFHLSAVDDRMRHPDDKPTIGLILCKSKRKLSAEYALRDIRKPIGIAAWKTKLERSLPKGFKGQLPSIADLEREIGDPPRSQL